MDQVDLDVVLAIEEHYADVREGGSEGPRSLLEVLVARGNLGEDRPGSVLGLRGTRDKEADLAFGCQDALTQSP